jgi:hypothetical protein
VPRETSFHGLGWAAACSWRRTQSPKAGKALGIAPPSSVRENLLSSDSQFFGRCVSGALRSPPGRWMAPVQICWTDGEKEDPSSTRRCGRWGDVPKSRKGHRLGRGNAGRNDRDSPRGRAPENDGQGDEDLSKAVAGYREEADEETCHQKNRAVKRDRVRKK